MNNPGVTKAACLLVLIGGLNWGLIGLGYFLNFNGNVVSMILGAWPVVEYIVYVLVGASAVYKAVKCGKCS